MTDQPSLSHVNDHGRPGMLDVGDKAVTPRNATARARVRLPVAAREAFREGDLHTKKGPVLHTAIVAGTQAVKRTSELIPFCHPVPIVGCEIEPAWTDDGDLDLVCRVRTEYRTGVEMEALTGASVAALTVYDMCKSLSHEIVIEGIELLEKQGGKRDVTRT